ncbi:MAG: hypothetical protein ACI8R9_000454 [Paraglaciecola sp.]|jgi:uncharacterized protein YdgA (DUF945 family)
MKKIIIAIAVIAAVGLVGPKFTGNAINQKIDNIIANINQMPGYRASIKNRETSWFSSSAVIKVGLDAAMFADAGLAATQMEMFKNLNSELNFTAQHGPFLTLNGFGFGLSAWKIETAEKTLREVLSYDKNKIFYTMTGNIGLFGGANFADNIPEFSLILQDDLAAESAFSGWNGSGTASSDSFSYRGEIESFVMSNDMMSVDVKSVKWDSVLNASWASALQGEFYDSAGSFTIGLINFDLPELGVKTGIESFVIDVETMKSDDGALMDVNMDYALKSIDLPYFKARDLIIKTQFKHLEKEFFKAYQEATAKPSEIEQAMAEIIKNKLLPQLQAAPELNITEMSGKIADGKFSGKILTKLVGIDSLPNSLEDPGFWISKVFVDSKLEADKPMAMWIGEQVVVSQIQADPNAAQMTKEEIKSMAAQQVDGVITGLTEQGMITVTADGSYEIVFTMQDGQALLNGKTMPLPF